MYTIPISRKEVEKRLSKYQKINYNQFRWWRTHQPMNKPLHNRQPLRDRILNGDFDLSCYKDQAYMCEYQLIDLLNECEGDYRKFLDKGKVMLARRKRLWEDYEKDEADRLSSLKNAFTQCFRCTKEQVEEEMLNCSGSLIDLYYIIEEKYRVYNIPQTRKRGRPRKVI